MNKQINIFCDGGVCGQNPSSIGGTYAFIFVDEMNRRLHSGSGVIVPKHMKLDSISNNLTELLAAVNALNAFKKWIKESEYLFDKLLVHTDSRVTKIRLEDGDKFKGIPDQLRENCLRLREELTYKVVLLAGHPTEKELGKGFAKRNGNKVSRWNVWCDRKCNELKKKLEK